MIKHQPKHVMGRVVVFAVILALLAFVKKAEDPINRLVAALQSWTAASPQEKVYLHMDKPYYTLGDTIWFKGYITVGSRHQLSAISGALYVDLINERDSVVKDLKLPITTGMAMGDIVLGDDVEEGNYRIRAYTQWMRNAGEEYYFDKTLTVGSVLNNGILTKADYRYKNIDGDQQLTATLNYTDDQGKPLANKSVLYRIVIDHNVVWTKTGSTDAYGNIPVIINNKNKIDLTGAYIRTTLDNSSKKEVTKDFPIKAALAQSDVQFFPESGNLINGVTSRVAFKAIGVDGLGIHVSGKIVEAGSAKEVVTFAATHAGMGSFFFRPQDGKVYTAQLTFEDGSTKTMTLPTAKDQGFVLSVYQPERDSILVRVYAPEKQQGQDLGLIVQSGGETVFASNISVNKPITSVWLDKSAFPTGISQFTLFDQKGEAINERIAFIKSNDRLTLDIKPNKGSYLSKKQVSIDLTAKNSDGRATAGNFSVSVIDERKIPSDEANETSIFSSLLLTSDLKGYIEKPNYYFVEDNEATDKALDNLMMTQGYRTFVWKDIVEQNNNTTILKYPAEGMGITISGTVRTLGHKPALNATVTLLSTRAKIAKFAITDADGKFKFDGMFVTDSIKFAVQARTKKGGDKLAVILDSIPKQKMTRNPNFGDLSTNIPGFLKAYIDAGKKQDEVNIKMGRMDRAHKLREVNIRAAKEKKEVFSTQYGIKIPEGAADRTVIVKDAASYGTLGIYLRQKLPNVGFKPFKPSPYNPEVENYPHYPFTDGIPLTIVLDGRKLDYTDAVSVFDNTLIELEDIVKIDVVLTNAALIATMPKIDPIKPPGPTLLIYTKPQDQRRRNYTPSIANITPKGFNKAREFYSPKYITTGANLQLPDMRNTIYWTPYLKTYGSGKGSFNFYTADGPATYRLTVEGINAEGQLGRKVIRFTVDGELFNGNIDQRLPDVRALANRIANKKPTH